MKENTVIPSTRYIVKRIQFQGMVSAWMVIALILFPLLASADEDPCRELGIYIGNQTMLDVWYTRNGGALHPMGPWSPPYDKTRRYAHYL